jgi:hypothetical protein
VQATHDKAYASVHWVTPKFDGVLLVVALCIFGFGALVLYLDIFYAGTALILFLWLLAAALTLIAAVVRGTRNLLQSRYKLLGTNLVAIALLVLPLRIPIYGWLRDQAFKRLNAEFIHTFAEHSKTSGEKFASVMLKDSGFAGSNSFTELIFDPSHEIEKPIQERSASWRSMMERKDALLVSPDCSTNLLKVHRDVYLVDITC